MSSPSPIPAAIPSTHMFVSTALELWWTDRPEAFARDFQVNDTIYRRLDPDYFAWLRAKMIAAKEAAIAGRIPLAAFDGLRLRFNAVQEWAIGRFGEPALLDAVRRTPSDYRPPVPEPWPANSHTPQPEQRRPDGGNPHAVAMVDAIREQALSLGWSHDALYRAPENRRGAFLLGGGLVCHLRDGWRIGEVTRQSIEIIGPPPLDVHQRFYNPDVEQPWIRRIKTAPE